MNTSTDVIRSFVAVKVPSNVLAEVEKYIQQLKQLTQDIRWVRPAAIHITLKFLGENSPDVTDQVANKLQDVSGLLPPFELTVKGTGCFPNRKRPRVFWIGLEPDADNSLFRLHQWIDINLKPLGFAREKRRFSAHLTMGRVKTQSDLTPVFSYMDTNSFLPCTFRVKSIILMKSQLQPSGAVYTPIQSYPLS